MVTQSAIDYIREAVDLYEMSGLASSRYPYSVTDALDHLQELADTQEDPYGEEE